MRDNRRPRKQSLANHGCWSHRFDVCAAYASRCKVEDKHVVPTTVMGMELVACLFVAYGANAAARTESVRSRIEARPAR